MYFDLKIINCSLKMTLLIPIRIITGYRHCSQLKKFQKKKIALRSQLGDNQYETGALSYIPLDSEVFPIAIPVPVPVLMLLPLSFPSRFIRDFCNCISLKNTIIKFSHTVLRAFNFNNLHNF